MSLETARPLAEAVARAGGRAVIVGGYVRDRLLGIDSKDLDIEVFGLSQDDLAHLLGAQDGTKVSRYERFARSPSLETVFACEVIFGLPASVLFAGLFAEAKEKTLRRAEGLLAALAQDPATDQIAGRKAWLWRLSNLVEHQDQPT